MLAPLLFIGFRKYAGQTLLGLSVIGLALVYFARLMGSKSFMLHPELMLEYTFFGHCFEFYCGYWLANFYKKKRFRETNNPEYLTVLGLSLMTICLAAITFTIGKQFPVSGGISYTVLVNNFLLPPTIGLFFYGLLTETTIIARLLSSRLFQLLGRHSYAFALLHAGLFYEFLYFHLSQNKLIIFLALNLLVAAMYRLLEAPI